jgi:hypothetical protein
MSQRDMRSAAAMLVPVGSSPMPAPYGHPMLDLTVAAIPCHTGCGSLHSADICIGTMVPIDPFAERAARAQRGSVARSACGDSAI